MKAASAQWNTPILLTTMIIREQLLRRLDAVYLRRICFMLILVQCPVIYCLFTSGVQLLKCMFMLGCWMMPTCGACWNAVSGDSGEFLQKHTPDPSCSASADMPCGTVEVIVKCSWRTGWERDPVTSFWVEERSVGSWKGILTPWCVALSQLPFLQWYFSLNTFSNLCLSLEISSFSYSCLFHASEVHM